VACTEALTLPSDRVADRKIWGFDSTFNDITKRTSTSLIFRLPIDLLRHHGEVAQVPEVISNKELDTYEGRYTTTQANTTSATSC